MLINVTADVGQLVLPPRLSTRDVVEVSSVETGYLGVSAKPRKPLTQPMRRRSSAVLLVETT
jgi:hypothetical protein